MSTDDYNFEDVDVPRGLFYGWGPKPGQVLTLDVVSYNPTGGTDFHDEPCPQVVGVTVADTIRYKEKGTEREKVTKGTLITLNCGQANLRRTVLAADPTPGDVLRITFEDVTEGSKGDIKLFKAQIARGQGTGSAAGAISSSDGDDDDDLI